VRSVGWSLTTFTHMTIETSERRPCAPREETHIKRGASKSFGKEAQTWTNLRFLETKTYETGAVMFSR
jgi:hypothetical protein